MIHVHSGAIAFDMLEIVKHLHADDAAELDALGVSDAQSVVFEHAMKSICSFTATDGDIPIAVGGVVDCSQSMYLRRGSLWFLTTKISRDHPIALARAIRRTVDTSILRVFDVLDALVHEEHEAGNRMAQFLGMHVADTQRAPTGAVFNVYARGA